MVAEQINGLIIADMQIIQSLELWDEIDRYEDLLQKNSDILPTHPFTDTVGGFNVYQAIISATCLSDWPNKKVELFDPSAKELPADGVAATLTRNSAGAYKFTLTVSEKLPDLPFSSATLFKPVSRAVLLTRQYRYDMQRVVQEVGVEAGSIDIHASLAKLILGSDAAYAKIQKTAQQRMDLEAEEKLATSDTKLANIKRKLKETYLK